MKATIIIFLLTQCVFTSYAQVSYKGQNLKDSKVEYLTVYQHVLGNTKGESKVYWICGHIKDSTDAVLEKEIKSAGLNFGKMETLTIKSIEHHALRDTAQNFIHCVIESDFFNIMSEAGYDFLKKDAPLAPFMIKKTAIIITNYTFKRR